MRVRGHSVGESCQFPEDFADLGIVVETCMVSEEMGFTWTHAGAEPSGWRARLVTVSPATDQTQVLASGSDGATFTVPGGDNHTDIHLTLEALDSCGNAQASAQVGPGFTCE